MRTVLSVDGTTICFDAWSAGQPLIMIDSATSHRAQHNVAAEVLAAALRQFASTEYATTHVQ